MPKGLKTAQMAGYLQYMTLKSTESLEDDMTETITSIKEVKDYKNGDRNDFDEPLDFIGYEVVTDKRTIRVLIDDYIHCCECPGYLCSEDNPSEFEGAKLLRFEVVRPDEGGIVKCEIPLVKDPYGHDDEEVCNAMFVDFVTDRGTFQIAVYNQQNGYYGHRICIMVDEAVEFEGEI